MRSANVWQLIAKEREAICERASCEPDEEVRRLMIQHAGRGARTNVVSSLREKRASTGAKRLAVLAAEARLLIARRIPPGDVAKSLKLTVDGVVQLLLADQNRINREYWKSLDKQFQQLLLDEITQKPGRLSVERLDQLRVSAADLARRERNKNSKRGKKSAQRKAETNADRDELIRERRGNGKLLKEIAAEFGLTERAIQNVLNRSDQPG